MGLDQFVILRKEDYADPEDNSEFEYWRKHPNLHGWMQNLWRAKYHLSEDAVLGSGTILDDDGEVVPPEVPISLEDLAELEKAVKEGALPETRGFFFGDDSSEYYFDTDLGFIINARKKLLEDSSARLFYLCSW